MLYVLQYKSHPTLTEAQNDDDYDDGGGGGGDDDDDDMYCRALMTNPRLCSHCFGGL